MSKPDNNPEARVALFQSREIRRTLHNDEWWFVITDIVAALTDAADPSDYWKKMRRRDPDLSLDSQGGGGQIDPPLALPFDTAGGRQKLQCWNTQGIFRLIQSIPSPKAEPFKRWLAKVGKERLDEYKQLKALARENLRDHMTDIELILTMLAEATTTKLHRDRDSVGMAPLKKDAKDGGAVAGRTRKDIEKQSGQPVISSANFKQLAVKKAKKIKGSES